MFKGGGKDEEVTFQLIQKYMEFPQDAKKTFLKMKMQRDSGDIHSTYGFIQDLIKKQKEYVDDTKDTKELAHKANLERILTLYHTRWIELVQERRKNEALFGSLWTDQYGSCNKHVDNMFFYWDDGIETMRCVGCERTKTEACWAKQAEEQE